MNRFCIIIGIFLVGIQGAFAQSASKYWVYLEAKDASLCAQNTQACHLLPPDSATVHDILKTGAQLSVSSSWLNAVSVYADSVQLMSIRGLDGISSIAPVLAMKSTKTQVPFNAIDVQNSHSLVMNAESIYGGSLEQLQFHRIDLVHGLGYDGTGVIVGIMDGGFDTQHIAFKHLRDSDRIIAERDFVDGGNDTKVNVTLANYHSHGTSTAGIIAGRVDSTIMGVAPGVSLVVARTEMDTQELPVEEDNWVAAIEWMQTLGVQVVSNSLGYNIFTNAPSQSYTYEDMDGKTSAISRAATKAASVFNMVVVTSAGNEGSSNWRYITTPADADSIITVGSINAIGNRVSSSSVGPTADGRIKPDVVARGACIYTAISTVSNGYTSCISGTSFAAPHVAGIMALALQAKPDMDAYWYVQEARKASSQFENPDNLTGYGIIDAFTLVNNILMSTSITDDPTFEPSDYFLASNYPNPFNPSTTLQYEAPAGWSVTGINIYSVIGTRIKTFSSSQNFSGGSVLWNGTNDAGVPVPSGVYLAKFTFSNGLNENFRVHTMSLIK